MFTKAATLVVMLVFASSLRAETPPEQEQAAKELNGIVSNLQRNRDGTVRFVRFSRPVVTNAHVLKTAAFPQLDYLAVVTPNVTDQGLDHVGQLTNLDTLLLSDSGITDSTMARLPSLLKLEHLYLDRTHITNTGLQHLANLSALKSLSLQQTSITDDGIAHLGSLTNLETLVLSDTAVTTASSAIFRALPKLKVVMLDHTRFTTDDIAVLRSDLPNLNVIAGQTPSTANNATHPFQRFLAGETLRSVQTFQTLDNRGPLQTPDTRADDLHSVRRQDVVRADLRFASEALSTSAAPDFQRHVIPLFGRLGCNGRTCHGSFQGKGGFSLSMFGYDFAADLKALTDGKTPRVNVSEVSDSLILTKPTSDEDHGGGQRFETGGWEYRLLHRWIAQGAHGVAETPAKLLRFEVTPAEIVFRKVGETTQLKCVAVWEDGVLEDVTPLTRFQSNDETVAEVSDEGLVTCKSAGDTYVVSFYDNGIFSSQVIMPTSDRTGDRYPQVQSPTEIDRLIVRKLSQLGVEPSVVCSDDEFLRRVSLDLAGTLPSVAELQAFRQDSSPLKRLHKVDELLATDAYATWWGTKLADLTGSNAQSLGSTDMNTPASEQWNAWLKRRVADNVGWDRIAAGIILATSRRPGQTYDQYAAEQSLHMKAKDGTDFTAHDNSMHYYWFRSNNQTETDRALTFGYTFLGVRFQCAQCHKHPFDQWSKHDFESFATIFRRIRTGIATDAKPAQETLMTKLGVPIKLDTASLRRQMYLRVSAEGLPIPWNEVYLDPPTEKPWPAKIPGTDEFDLNHFADPREPLFAWLVDKQNPYFAPSFVNRVWAHYFGVGIVDPPDDFNMANPPSNKALLAWLSDQFIEHHYDLRWLHRTITTSHAYQRSSIVISTNRTDDRNFSRGLVRRMPAEVTIDAILRATANDETAARYLSSASLRKIGQHPKSYQARGIDYSLLIFGKPLRTTSCDCERQDQPTLLQSLYVRNDDELIGWLERPDGWLKNVSKQLQQTLSSEVKLATSASVPSSDDVRFVDDPQTAELIQHAYRRTLSRDASTDELQTSLAHIQQCENTVEGLRDILWALVNTQEFLTNH